MSWTTPLKRNWKPGSAQVSAFLRTPEGGQVSMCHDSATADERQLVLWLVSGAHRMSDKLKERLRSEWEALRSDIQMKRNGTENAPKKRRSP